MKCVDYGTPSAKNRDIIERGNCNNLSNERGKVILIIEFIYNYNLDCSLYHNLWRVFSNEINVAE